MTRISKITVLILLIFTIHSCCKESVESGRLNLQPIDKDFIPYQLNQKTHFIHSNGFEFDFTTIVNEIRLDRSQTKHCGDSYYTFETKNVTLESRNPELKIDFIVYPKKRFQHTSINISNTGFILSQYSKPTIDSLLINGKMYKDIYEAENPYSDSTIIAPKQVLYNTNKGILQIKYTNNETYTIKE